MEIRDGGVRLLGTSGTVTVRLYDSNGTTMLNSVTFGHNVALAALGSGSAAPAEERWQRRIDALASVVLAIPAAVFAVPVELAGAVFRRGAVVDLRFELL